MVAVGNGLVVLTLGALGEASLVVGVRVVPVEFDGEVELDNGAVVILSLWSAWQNFAHDRRSLRQH